MSDADLHRWAIWDARTETRMTVHMTHFGCRWLLDHWEDNANSEIEKTIPVIRWSQELGDDTGF